MFNRAVSAYFAGVVALTLSASVATPVLASTGRVNIAVPSSKDVPTVATAKLPASISRMSEDKFNADFDALRDSADNASETPTLPALYSVIAQAQPSSATNVAPPATSGMLLAGLGLLGMIARRRIFLR